jgi:hypothetical protein
MNQVQTPQAKVSRAFVRRFDAVRWRMLQVQVARALLGALLAGAVGLALLAAVDYLWEIPRLARALGLWALGLSALAVTIHWLIAAIRRSNRARTAFEIEEHFPELGQSVRTAVQFGERSDDADDGARASLVDALEEQIDLETRPLPIEAVVPSGRLKIALAIAVALALLLGVFFVGDREWNTAGRRTLLQEQPYTTLSVTPGNAQVEEGQAVSIGIELTGRTARKVTLFVRNTDGLDAEWREQEVSPDEAVSSTDGALRYEVLVSNVREPFAYRVSAGNVTSDEYQVTVKYPLRLENVSVELTPPEYTRAEPTVTIDGNIAALEGTIARFRFELDRPAASASVELADPRDVLTRNKAKIMEDEQPPEVVPLAIDGTALTMELEVTTDKVYSLRAEAADGMKLPETSFRIRVRKDQPPQITFDEPNEALEVHTLAEVLMRIRVRDDFGLKNAGIVFQVNNEEEHMLLMRDFDALLESATRDESASGESAAEGAAPKKPAPSTQAVLDKVLPLEHFDLKEQDSVTYYAFAEDNFPEGGHRTESDLRFVDIRPFRRLYKLIDPMPDGMPMTGRPLLVLSELIARQRFALNQAMRLARRPESAAADVGAVDRVIEFEQKLAVATRETAEFLEARAVPGNDLLFQAEEAMLAAVDSLTVGKYDTAVLKEKDALRYLIEGRRTINQELLKKPPKTQAEARAFDRRQTQKLRKPKNEEDAEQVAERLRQLAADEEFVYETLSGIKMDEDMPGSDGKGGGGKQKPDAPPEPKETASGTGDQPAADPEQKADVSNGGNEKDPEAKPGKGGQSGDPDDQSSGEDNMEKPNGGKPSREEIVQKQADIAAEAADVQRVMEKMNNLTDLAKSRINAAAKGAQQSSDALERGDSKGAAEAAGMTTGMFRELARQVEALAAAETPRRLAMARDMSEELSQTEQDFAGAVERLQKSEKGSGESPNKPDKTNAGNGEKPAREGEKTKGSGPNDGDPGDRPGAAASENGPEKKTDSDEPGGGEGTDRSPEALAARADRIAEAGKTLEDVLKTIARSTEPADKEAATSVHELLEQGKLGEAVKRLEMQGDALRAGKPRETAAEAREMADRFDVAAQQLEVIHRAIVAPRIAELLKMERRAGELQDKLDHLETPAQITAWHRDADDLLDQLDKAGFAEEPREELLEAMKGAGWEAGDVARDWNWALLRGVYGAPVGYHRSIRRVVAELQSAIQELILGDLGSAANEAAPPQYERLVDRYYQVLSTDK